MKLLLLFLTGVIISPSEWCRYALNKNWKVRPRCYVEFHYTSHPISGSSFANPRYEKRSIIARDHLNGEEAEIAVFTWSSYCIYLLPERASCGTLSSAVVALISGHPPRKRWPL
ncbi:hypothetical protein ARMGADRAFT_558808 [Armillaria gallica]|uniref:Uncharacterized protein n=1 Tax=Armillaria gallica TaxID=47427 RepID=A0A2H3D280_ARMGA|nr:hypothetical protein ARMGADRAFT_558808 [Armillaria gallica]